MNSYENEIMELLQGDTPRQKFEYLQELLKSFLENRSDVEISLLNICNELDKKGEEMFAKFGNESYEQRCTNHDTKMLIYGLTNKSKIEKMTYIKWREEVQSKRS
jgi:hypothetical protein